MSRADSWDWLFIVAFVFFALTSFLMDPLAAFHIPLSAGLFALVGLLVIGSVLIGR